MDARLKEEDKIMDERLAVMPFVSADYGKMPSYAIMRIAERKIKILASIKGFMCHMTREKKTPNSDPERRKNNKQVYGPEDLYEDSKNYLQDCKIYKASVIGREILLSSSPQWFINMGTKDFEHWIDINVKWLKDTFGENFRAAYLHLCESSPHIHGIIIPKLWNEKKNCYTLQNYRYFNGYQALRDMQDSYAEAMQKEFSTLFRGVRFSKSRHTTMKKLYGIANTIEKETDIEELKAKATRQELLKLKLNYMDKTLKSFQHMNHKKDETNEKLQQENERLQKQIEELKKNMNSSKELKQENVQDNKKGIKKGFSGKRYNKSV